MRVFFQRSMVIISSFSLLSCGRGDVNRVEEQGGAVEVPYEKDQDKQENLNILTLSLAGDGYACPESYNYNPSSKLCERAVNKKREAMGPFTQNMINLCAKYGGGSACGRTTWDASFAAKLRGTQVCPRGSWRHATGVCLEGESAFGPFPKNVVQTCEEEGYAFCDTLKWPKADAIAIAQATPKEIVDRYTFPYTGPASRDYVTPPRSFGSCRSGCGRRHAAADLYSYTGRSIYAVGDGKIIDKYYFYDGTYALVVDHGDFIVRYGEIKSYLPSGLRIGSYVKRGQVIAYVGDLLSLSVSMLHFERYTGKGRGPLTVRSRYPYQRRWDLVNPTADLIKWKYPR